MANALQAAAGSKLPGHAIRSGCSAEADRGDCPGHLSRDAPGMRRRFRRWSPRVALVAQRAYKRGVATNELIANAERLESALLSHHRAFLAFLERRLGSSGGADEVLQTAYARALEKGVPDDDASGVVAWFYRVLRNALVDRARRDDADRRSTARLAAQAEPLAGDDPELREAVCACMHDLLPAMKPEYAQVVRAVDLEERSLAEVAAGGGITVNNATVRLHRARQALKQQLLRACGACAAHGCLECSCRTGSRPGGKPAT